MEELVPAGVKEPVEEVVLISVSPKGNEAIVLLVARVLIMVIEDIVEVKSIELLPKPQAGVSGSISKLH